MGVAIEEMAHLALVNNLLVSVGGAACFDRPNFPIPPGYHPANIVIRLTPFSEATLAHFVYLEHPEDIDIQDHPEFTSQTHYTRLPVGYGLTPSTPDYATVGGFYAAIRDAICHLADSEAALFVGACQNGQAGPTLVKLPGLVSIIDKASALTAIDTIVEQGEGASKHRDGSPLRAFSSDPGGMGRTSSGQSRLRPSLACCVRPGDAQTLGSQMRSRMGHR